MEKEGCTTSLKSQCSQLKQSQPFLAPSHCGKALSKPESPPRGLQTDTLDPDFRGLGPGRPTLSLICLCLFPPPLSPSSQRRDTTEFGKRMWSGAQLTVQSPSSNAPRPGCLNFFTPLLVAQMPGVGSEAAVSRHPWPARPKLLFHLPDPPTDALFQRDRRKWDPGWHSSSICMLSVLDPSCPI